MYIAHKRHVHIPYIFLGKAACILVIMISLFLIVLMFLPAKSASAGNIDNITNHTYTITSVQIKTGDTLWSIAKEHYSEEFSSLNSLVIEIKRINGLSSDTIYAGNYILVPQYIVK